MSIFDKLFGSAPQQPAQPQQQAQQVQPGNMDPNKANTADPANPMVPNGTVADSNKPAESPLDQFKDLWQPAQIKQGETSLLNVDPSKLAEAARKTDFSKLVSAETMAKIQEGGPDAQMAFMQAMNQMSQGVYAQSAFATSKIVEAAVEKSRKQWEQSIPQHIKKQQVSDTLRTENPVFNHPAASPILGAIEAQLTTKFPSASASEISGMAKQYLENFAGVISAPKQKAADEAAKKTSRDTDFSNWA